MDRLNAQTALPAGVLVPGYTPSSHGIGVVHIGLGAFHKAHQAVYTDAALAHQGGDWRIAAVSLRSAGPSAELTPQDGRYCLIERGPGAPQARVIGSIAEALHLGPDSARIHALLTAPSTRVVTITVTEKGYGLDRATGGIDPDHPAIAHDLANPDAPIGLAGLLITALAERHAAGTPPFTVLSCDNLPENGVMLKGLLVDFARHARPALADFIENHVATPSCMVDRITPASTDATREAAAALLGVADHAAIEAEPFTQWVIEDRFPTGRPAWQAGGALLTDDVRPFEAMKLRMLNGAHSMLAYVGFHAGCRYVRDAMAHEGIARLVARHMAAASRTLEAPAGFSLTTYADDLVARFANPAIAHETFQIAMDGSQKLPQRLFAPALDARARGQSLEPYAFAAAAWMRHVTGDTRDCGSYEIRDARAAEITAALAGAATAGDIVKAIQALPGIVPETLSAEARWTETVCTYLSVMLDEGMARAIERACSAL